MSGQFRRSRVPSADPAGLIQEPSGESANSPYKVLWHVCLSGADICFYDNKVIVFFENNCYQSLQAGQKNIRLVVMENIFPSGVKMHLKFDLKGSTHGRKVIQFFLFNLQFLSGIRKGEGKEVSNLQGS